MEFWIADDLLTDTNFFYMNLGDLLGIVKTDPNSSNINME
jgi:hypothetical protein